MHITRKGGCAIAAALFVLSCKLLRRGEGDKDKDFPVDTTTPPPTVAATAPSADPIASGTPSAGVADIVDAAVIDPRIAARNQALREAAEFGMIGMLGGDGGDTAPWGGGGTGGTIGLGNIGTLGGSSLTDGGRRRSPSIRQGTTSVNGRLPPEVIQRIVRQNFGRFRLCYENGLRSNPVLQGRISVTFVIARDGSITSVKDGGSDMPDTGVVQCVVRGFGNLSFPQPEAGIVTVTFPLIFNPAS